jgi:hypothetical protein
MCYLMTLPTVKISCTASTADEWRSLMHYWNHKPEVLGEKPVPAPPVHHVCYMGSNPGLRSERPATNRLSHGRPTRPYSVYGIPLCVSLQNATLKEMCRYSTYWHFLHVHICGNQARIHNCLGLYTIFPWGGRGADPKAIYNLCLILKMIL